MIEGYLAKKYNVKKVPFKKYLTINEASIVLGIHPHEVFPYARDSNLVHGIIVSKNLFLHPEGIREEVRRRFQAMLKKDIKRVRKIKRDAALRQSQLSSLKT